METLLAAAAQADSSANIARAIRAEVTRMFQSDDMLVLDCPPDVEVSPAATGLICTLIEEALVCIVRAGGAAAGAKLRIGLAEDRGRIRLTLRGAPGAHGGGVDASRVEAVAACLGGFARVDHTPFGSLEVTAIFRKLGPFAGAK